MLFKMLRKRKNCDALWKSKLQQEHRDGLPTNKNISTRDSMLRGCYSKNIVVREQNAGSCG
jgi:hypothetical protein